MASNWDLAIQAEQLRLRDTPIDRIVEIIGTNRKHIEWLLGDSSQKAARQKAWADIHTDEVIKILKENAIQHIIKIDVSDPEDDMGKATDMVIKVTGGDVAVRLRTGERPERDLTIRSYNKGYKTELEKLRDGFGDWYFYAWFGPDNHISEWLLADINQMRISEILDVPRFEIPNGDGTKFISITIDELQATACLITSYGLELL